MTYTTGWNIITVQSNAVIYFQQEQGNDPFILSTPQPDLTNATQLTFSFQSPSGSTKLKVGTMTDPSNPGTFQLLATFNPPPTYQTFTVALSNVDATTHISFYRLGSFWYTANLDNVLVLDDQMENNVPAAVSSLLLEPASMGGNSFDVSWTNPVVEADGDPLTDLDSVVLEINGTPYQTILNGAKKLSLG